MKKSLPFTVLILFLLSSITFAYSIDELEKTVKSKDYNLLDKQLSANNENINVKTSGTFSPPLANIAINNNDIATLRVLLNHGADLNVQEEPNQSGYEKIITKGNEDIISFVFSRKIPDKDLISSLYKSLYFGKIHCIKTILANHNNEIFTTSEIQFLNLLVYQDKIYRELGYRFGLHRVEIINLLLEAGFDPYLTKKNRISAVDLAYKKQDITALKLIDTNGQYLDYIKTFTPVQDSPFIGYWLNEPTIYWSEKTYSYVQFADDGKVLSGGVDIAKNELEGAKTHSISYWRKLNDHSIEIVSPNMSGKPKKKKHTFTYNPDDDSITKQIVADDKYLDFLKKNGIKTTEKLKRINKFTMIN